MNALQALLRPRSIAVIGASAELTRISGRPLKFLRDKGYSGHIFPVNPKYDRIDHWACYPSVAALPETPDLAIIAVPATAVLSAVEALGQRGVPAAVIFSSGFGEMGESGKALEGQVLAAARRSGLRLCGPNCLGLINAYDQVMATFGQFADGETPAGPVGFVTQSGAFGTAIAALARRRRLGLGYFVNTGNECDIDFVQVMREVFNDDRIHVGAGYLEGVKDGDGLKTLAMHALDIGKPLVLTKVGRTGAGAKAAASHTGALAGADAVFDGVMRGFGVTRARNEEHMLDIVEVLGAGRLPEGNGVGIVTQSGGAAVLMADRCEEVGLKVAELAPATRERLAGVIPAFGSASNPVDITGQFVAEPQLLLDSMRIVLDDPGVDVGVVWLQLMDAHVEKLLDIFRHLQTVTSKPWVVCWVAASDAALAGLRAAGIPALRGAEPAVDAIAALVQYAAARRRWCEDAPARSALRVPELRLPASAGPLPSLEAQDLLRACAVPVAEARVVSTANTAVAAAEALGYPVALKIESPDILHKTEAKGVLLNLGDPASVRAGTDALMRNARAFDPNARLTGVLVQTMTRGNVELVIGLQRDPVFGAVVMVGLGGVLIEVLKDVAFRAAPVTASEALSMLNELKGAQVLDGVRGGTGVDRCAVARMVSAVSLLGVALGDRLESLDLNPVLGSGDTVKAVDWLLLLK
jgi:acyl-CoA synthetase (NDP forming)